MDSLLLLVVAKGQDVAQDLSRSHLHVRCASDEGGHGLDDGLRASVSECEGCAGVARRRWRKNYLPMSTLELRAEFCKHLVEYAQRASEPFYGNHRQRVTEKQ